METTADLDFNSCYRAVTARDARFDGLFFTAVRTTRIYCRSVCPARTPRASSCEFFSTAAAAERAGFRPCLRCRPELAPGRGDFSSGLASAILARLQEGALDERSLEDLAAAIGLSSRQVRRVLHSHFGVTPVEVAQTQRLLFAKKLLHETALSMTEVALAAGFGSLRRFNAIFRERYGLPPSALRRAAGGAAGPSSIVTIRLAFRTPFAWDAALEYLALRATAGVERVCDGAYERTLALAGRDGARRGWLRVARRSDAEQLEVSVEASLATLLLPISNRLRALFDLDADSLRIAAHLAADARLADQVASTPGLRVLGAWDPFELAVRTVLGQQVSVAGASTLAGRLVAALAEPIATPIAGLTHLAVQPAQLAGAPVEAVMAIGLPRARATTLVGLGRFAQDGAFERLRAQDIDSQVASLMSVPGIGPWTAQYVAMRALRQPDAFPAGDLGLRRACADKEGKFPSERELENLSQAWRPWRAYAAAYLWRGTVPLGE